MIEKRSPAQKKRDLILVTMLFFVMGGLFLFFRFFAFQSDASRANVYYGNSDEPIVTIDFVNYRVLRNYDQGFESDEGEPYPIIDELNRTITLLGDYQVNGVRQIIVISYNFDRKSVQIIEETSPNNICSREGESTGWPLICLPNRVRVEFEASDEDFTV